MTTLSFVVLHGGPALEVHLFEYLFRVVLYLIALGVVAAVVSWGLDVASAIHSGVAEQWGWNDR